MEKEKKVNSKIKNISQKVEELQKVIDGVDTNSPSSKESPLAKWTSKITLAKLVYVLVPLLFMICLYMMSPSFVMSSNDKDKTKYTSKTKVFVWSLVLSSFTLGAYYAYGKYKGGAVTTDVKPI